MSRRQYPKHKNDGWDRFITERSQGPDGKFSFERFRELFDQLDCPDLIPAEGNNGTRRMTAGIQLRSYYADGVIRFRDGSTVTLNIEDEP
jgi:hypothetical protein